MQSGNNIGPFNSPIKSTVPETFPDDWKVSNEIDHFIFDKINQASLTPSDQASKERLLKRVSMDLLGLPPNHSRNRAIS